MDAEEVVPDESDGQSAEEFPSFRGEFGVGFVLELGPGPVGGLFGSGDHWEPSPAMFANFSGTVYWYRAYDLSNGGFRQLGTWRYTCRRHLGQSMDAPAAQPATEPAKS